MSNEQLKRRLTGSPDWQSLTAYDMTIRLCSELTVAGEKIPAWHTVREIIGKGSSSDINRAKDDFRKRHADELRKMGGFVEGVPEELGPHIRGFWIEAISYVRKENAAHQEACDVAVETANQRVAELAELAEKDKQAALVLQAELEGLQRAQTILQQQLVTEQSTRAQAERLLEAAQVAQSEQRKELMGALERSQQELSDAITRLEGVETHALRQVQEARDDAKKKVDVAESRLKGLSSDHAIEVARLNRQLREAQQHSTEGSKAIALLEQDNDHLRQRAERAEALVQAPERPSEAAGSFRSRVSSSQSRKTRKGKV